MATKRNPKPSRHYTADQKKMVLTFVRFKGRGGVAAARREFGVSAVSIYRWIGESIAKGTRNKFAQNGLRPNYFFGD